MCDGSAHHLNPRPRPSSSSSSPSGGTLGGVLPILAVFYMFMLRAWNGSVDELADHHDPSHVHRMSMLGSLDESDGEEDREAEPGLGELRQPPTPAPAY